LIEGTIDRLKSLAKLPELVIGVEEGAAIALSNEQQLVSEDG